MFSTYEQAKEMLAKVLPNNPNISNFTALAMAGSLSACAALPFDNAKTKL